MQRVGDNSQQGTRPYFTLGMIMCVLLLHSMDRTIGSIILEPVRAEFDLNDAQLGIIGSLAFGSAFAITSLPIGWAIDRFQRRVILPSILAVWSVMTMATGLAQSFLGLVAARFAVGGSEAGGNPASVSLMSDLFPPERRASAFGFMLVGTAVGSSLAAALGGGIAERYGWRMLCLAGGVPGLLLAILFFMFVREPVRGAMDGSAPASSPPIRSTVRFLIKQRTLVHLFIGMSIATGILSSTGAWTVSYLMRVHDFSLTAAGVVLAIKLGPCLAIGSVLGGLISDRVGGESPRRRLWLGIAALLLSLPASMICYLSDSAPVAVTALIVSGLLVPAYLPAGTAMTLNVTPPQMRGIMVSARQLCANLFGFALGPFVVGLISVMLGGNDAIRYALVLVLTIIILFSAWQLYLASRYAERDIARAVAYGREGEATP